jgi:RNA polymerase-binding transcription factor DksA
MRHHFHRCGHLRVLALDASDLSHARKGGSQILEELCEAKRLARCVGLAECDVLSAAQKRDLLSARATRLREESGGPSPLADVPEPRASELRALRRELQDEYEQIVEDNRRRGAEAAAALQRNPRPLRRAEEGDLAVAAVSPFLDEELRELRSTRLDALERAFEALDRGRFGYCARCRRPIEVERLRLAPDTAVCDPCAREALPDPLRPAWADPEPSARVDLGTE